MPSEKTLRPYQSRLSLTKATLWNKLPELTRTRVRQLLAQMLQPMFAGLDTEGPFGGGNAERIYRSLLVQEYGKALASRGGIGLADAVAQEMIRLQEGQPQ